MLLNRNDLLRLAGALLVALSGGIHFRLHRTQYREIHLDRVLGIDLAGSFVLAVVAAAVVSLALVATVVWRRWERAASIAGILYGVGALAAYAVTRTVGLLGFEENAWTTEATVSKVVELALVVLLALSLSPVLDARRDRRAASGVAVDQAPAQ